MNQDQITPLKGAAPMITKQPAPASGFSRARHFWFLAVLLLACFAKPLLDLIRFSFHSELFSHILLIPFITAYLVWLKKDTLPRESRPIPQLALIPFGIGVLILVAFWFVSHSGFANAAQDRLTWTTLSFFFFFLGVCFLCLGPDTLREIAFPLVFFIFIVPFPRFLVDWFEAFLQHASALSAHILFTVTGMSFFRDGLLFQLPGIRLEVAPECSGIHSTLVLLITSLVAGQLFLSRLTNRILLTLAVIPLGIVRNAFRIWVIGELCVHVSPEMINSPIHRRGGPLFFALSLLPLFLLLYYQRRSELKTKSQMS